mgnify:CR=1 FL=1
MRRKDREQSREFALSVIDSCEFASLACLNADGTPYCVPLSIAREGDALYFHCAAEGQKLDNIGKNPQVCISFVSESTPNEQTYSVKYASAIVTGSAHVITDDAQRRDALRLICARFAPSNPGPVEAYIDKYFARTCVVRVDIESITGKSNT